MGSTMRGMSKGTAQEKQVDSNISDATALSMTPDVSLEPFEPAVPVSIDSASEATPEQDLESTAPVLESNDATPSETASVVLEVAGAMEQITQNSPPAEKKSKPKPPAKKSGKTADQKKVTTPKAET